eukprot:8283853-Karenia_brevis.AAC.2
MVCVGVVCGGASGRQVLRLRRLWCSEAVAGHATITGPARSAKASIISCLLCGAKHAWSIQHCGVRPARTAQ